ncbi:MAG: tetratricopeptide repeat protein [Acidobacteriota bacterium]
MRLNTDTPEGKELSRAFSLRGIPTTVILDGQGKEVDRIIGYEGRSEWTRTLLAYLYGVDTLDDLLLRHQAAASPELARDIAEKYLGRGSAKDALVWVETARSGWPSDKAQEALGLDLIQGQALLREDPPKGQEVLKGLALKGTQPYADEAFDALSGHHRRQARTAKSPEEKQKAQGEMLALYHEVLPSKQEDSGFLNGYAWHCAELGVELDKAALAAQRAVTLSQEDAGILDTLAEVYYKMGKRSEALAAIEKAVAKNPDDAYLKGQREKILKMDAGPQ